MRFAGIVFLLVGVLLCATITWAGLGFVAMSFGLIALMIAEERVRAAASRFSPEFGSRPALPSDVSGTDQAAQEQEKWKRLVETDEDISRVVKALLPFGQKYVDQLSRTYLIFNDKACLPIILRMITISAGQNTDAAVAFHPGAAAGVTTIPLRRPSDTSVTAIDPIRSHAEAKSESSQGVDKVAAETPLPINDPNPTGPQKAITEEKELRLLLGRIAFAAGENQ